MAAAEASSRKRSAPDGSSASSSAEAAAAGGNKHPRFTFGSIDDYERLDVLGKGVSGVVQKARHRRTGKAVAVKGFRRGSDLREIIREAECQTACRGDPAIVEVEDVVEDAGTGEKFIVMELFGSCSLTGHVDGGRRRSEEETRAMMRQLVGAAKTMHDAGVIHCDIKPDNVLVGGARGGDLKVCDFGMATPLIKPPGKPTEKMNPGTLVYSSPELLADSWYHGPAVDMWALGCIMAELLAGEPLFSDDDLFVEPSELRNRIAEHCAAAFSHRLPELSEPGRELLSGLLAFDPEERLTAAAALQHPWFTEKADSAAKLCGSDDVPLGDQLPPLGTDC